LDPLIKSPCGLQCRQSFSSCKPGSIRPLESIQEPNAQQTSNRPCPDWDFAWHAAIRIPAGNVVDGAANISAPQTWLRPWLALPGRGSKPAKFAAPVARGASLPSKGPRKPRPWGRVHNLRIPARGVADGAVNIFESFSASERRRDIDGCRYRLQRLSAWKFCGDLCK